VQDGRSRAKDFLLVSLRVHGFNFKTIYRRRFAMGKKAAKSSRKFAASGQLKKTIQARRKHQEIQKKIRSKKARKGGAEKHAQLDVPEESGDDDDGHEGSSTNYK
jgi:hypothetical protein